MTALIVKIDHWECGLMKEELTKILLKAIESCNRYRKPEAEAELVGVQSEIRYRICLTSKRTVVYHAHFLNIFSIRLRLHPCSGAQK